MLAVFALGMFELWLDHRNYVRDLAAQTHNHAEIMAARLEATLRRADAALRSLTHNAPPVAPKPQEAVQQARRMKADLDFRMTGFPELMALRLFDASGRLLYGSGGARDWHFNIADRPHFRRLQQAPDLALAFSEVEASRDSGRQAMVMARAWRDARGELRGVAVALLDLAHFESLFRTLAVGRLGVAALRRTEDGRAVMLWPPNPAELNQPLPADSPLRQSDASGMLGGTLQWLTSADGVHRVYGFHAVERYPFYVAVGMAPQEALAGWYKVAAAIGAGAALLLGLLSLQMFRLWQARGREREAWAQVARSERRTRLLAKVFEHTAESILITDRDNRIVEVNPSFTRLTGYSAEEVRGQDPRMLASGLTRLEDYQAMWQAIVEQGRWRGEIWDRNKDGTIFPAWMTISVIRDEAGEIENYIGSFIEISERKRSEEEMAHLAFHDALTGLPNRYSLTQRLTQVLARARREGERVALLFLDLDGLKMVNDQLGHHAGDELLKVAASRLINSVRGSDVVARLGGDEFVVVLPGVDERDIARMADKMRKALAQPHALDGHVLETSASIGVALFPDDGRDAADLMRHADTAMYQAKTAGRNGVRMYLASAAGPAVAATPVCEASP